MLSMNWNFYSAGVAECIVVAVDNIDRADIMLATCSRKGVDVCQHLCSSRNC